LRLVATKKKLTCRLNLAGDFDGVEKDKPRRRKRMNMKWIRYVSFILFFALFGGVAAFAQEVRTDYDKKVNFEQFHTYSWGKVQTSNPFWESRIKDAVDKALGEKGWQKVDSGGDVVLMAVGGTKNQQEYQTFYDGLGGWRWGGFGDVATTTVQNYRVGTLVLDMYQANSKQLIWRGTSTNTLSNNTEHNEKDLDKGVDKMFKKFPPNK
jgi:hypothetical protein